MFSQLARYASELNVPIEDAEMGLRMSYDTRGKLLLDEVSPAAQKLEYTFEIKSPASADKIRELVQMIDKGCHTINTIRDPTPITAKVIHNGVEL